VIDLVAGLGGRWIWRGPYQGEVSLLTVSLGLTLTTLILIRGLDSDGVLGTFVAAAVFNRFLPKNNVPGQHRLQEALGTFLSCRCSSCSDWP